MPTNATSAADLARSMAHGQTFEVTVRDTTPVMTGAEARAEARRLSALAAKCLRGSDERLRLLEAATAMYVLSDEMGGE